MSQVRNNRALHLFKADTGVSIFQRHNYCRQLAAIAAAKSTTCSSVVFQEHIQRT
jgi:hypothetical protein